MPDEEEICRICKNPRREHEGFKHKFTVTGALEVDESGDTPKKGTPDVPRLPQAALRSDPILRIVMIRKGLITEQELTEAEEELRTAGVIYGTSITTPAGPDSDGGGGEPSSGGMRGAGGNPLGDNPQDIAEQIRLPV